jgi:hypothetical protein
MDSVPSIDQVRKGSGWVFFAGVMLGIAALFNFIDGIAAVSKADSLVNQELFANLEFWGVVLIIVGLLQGYASWAIFQGKESGVMLGIFFASLNAVIQMMAIVHYPVWSLLVIATDFLIIYALAVYGGRQETV